MSALLTYREFVGVGIYTIPDAAHLLKASPRTIRRWMTGYSYARYDEKHEVAELWQPDLLLPNGDVELSFRDLIELRFINKFLAAGLHLRTIRNCLRRAQDVTESTRPFSSGRFRTDGKTLFLEMTREGDTPDVIDLRKNQYAFHTVIKRSFRDLEFEDDQVVRWRPFRGKHSIVIDPKRSFGQPVATRTGVPTIVLAEAVAAEGTVARVASLYDVSRATVQDAVAYHQELAAA